VPVEETDSELGLGIKKLQQHWMLRAKLKFDFVYFHKLISVTIAFLLVPSHIYLVIPKSAPREGEKMKGTGDGGTGHLGIVSHSPAASGSLASGWVRTLEKRKARHIYLTRQTSTLECGRGGREGVGGEACVNITRLNHEVVSNWPSLGPARKSTAACFSQWRHMVSKGTRRDGRGSETLKPGRSVAAPLSLHPSHPTRAE
jgi:hypothetical protein